MGGAAALAALGPAVGTSIGPLIGTAHAQGLSDRPIKIVVPYGPGGTSDIVARSLQEPLRKALQRTLVIENKAGATGSIAARYVANAPPDGTTVLVPNTGNVLAPLMQDKQSFIDYRTSFTPIAQVADVPMVMVISGDTPAANVAEFIAYVKANPGKVNYGTAGVGSFGHLAGELFQRMTGTKMEVVPYSSGSQTDVAVANGEVKMMINSLPDARIAIGLGKGAKAIAVTTAGPTPLMPGVPPMSDTIPGFLAVNHFGVLAPPKTPANIVAILGDAIRSSMADEAVREQYTKLGLEPRSGSSEELAKLIADDYARWEPVIASLNIGK